jgi:hypothetical protein
MCTVSTDISKVRPEVYTDAAGELYYKTSFEVVLLFGLTKLKAQIAYIENVSVLMWIIYNDSYLSFLSFFIGC